MDQEFSAEQKELMGKVTVEIKPAFNGEYIIETFSQQGDFLGRFNVTDTDLLLGAIRSVYTNVDLPPRYDVN